MTQPKMRPARRRLCAALLLAVSGAASWAAPPTLLAQAGAESVPKADDRGAALVIGNSAYRVGALKNPVNDAQAVAASLRGLGFEVVLRENTSLRDMIEAFRQFSVSARAARVRVIFYAGHGVQVKGRNYLLPVDTEIRAEDEVPAKSADLNELLDRLAAMQQGINIVILDACRINPFSTGVIVGPDGRRIRFRGATAPGLAPLDAPVGTLVAFSTAPNGVALDGANEKHSIYAKHLLANLTTPGIAVEQLFKKVRIGVAEETQRVQVPWESSSLTADFCFKSNAAGRCGPPA